MVTVVYWFTVTLAIFSPPWALLLLPKSLAKRPQIAVSDILQEEEKFLHRFGWLCFCPFQNKVHQTSKSTVGKTKIYLGGLKFFRYSVAIFGIIRKHKSLCLLIMTKIFLLLCSIIFSGVFGWYSGSLLVNIFILFQVA